jgi:hydroxymethylpyrimidine kinase/phosphomethylpyrimidine kinase
MADRRKVCLTIAGFDPSGGAGILADVGTFAAFDRSSAAAVTSITFQNDEGVYGAIHQSARSLREQLEPVFATCNVAAVKIGMLPTAELVREVVSILKRHKVSDVVLDPVIRSSSGFALIEDDAIAAMTAELFPLTLLITPNIPEAERIADRSIRAERDVEKAAAILGQYGTKNVLIKGGHFDAESSVSRDYLFIDGALTTFDAERTRGRNVRGTGCMLSSAIAANLAVGNDLARSVEAAKAFVTEQIRRAVN